MRQPRSLLDTYQIVRVEQILHPETNRFVSRQSPHMAWVETTWWPFPGMYLKENNRIRVQTWPLSERAFGNEENTYVETSLSMIGSLVTLTVGEFELKISSETEHIMTFPIIPQECLPSHPIYFHSFYSIDDIPSYAIMHISPQRETIKFTSGCKEPLYMPKRRVKVMLIVLEKRLPEDIVLECLSYFSHHAYKPFLTGFTSLSTSWLSSNTCQVAGRNLSSHSTTSGVGRHHATASPEPRSGSQLATANPANSTPTP